MPLEQDIEQALINQAKLLALFDVNILIDYPGIPFQPPTDNRWLELRNFRNNIGNDPTWGATERQLYGIFQLTICDPLNIGDIPSIAIASQIIDGFTKGSRLTYGAATVQIYKQPWLMSTIDDRQTRRFPVSVSYRCDNF